MIKMIALDLDNTLLDSDKKITKETEMELKKISEKGIRVVLCTGRPINAIWNYIEQLGLNKGDNYTITFNGALVINNVDRSHLFKRGISKVGFKPLYDFAKKNDFPLDVLDFEQVYPIIDLKKSNYQKMLNNKINFAPTSFNDLPDENFSKAVMVAEPKKVDKIVKAMPTGFTDRYHIVRSQPKIIEFLPPEVDKSFGLGALLSHYGMDFSNLMAFGDAENDAGMIEKAGIGVSMKNGQPAIKTLANEVTKQDNNHDGVAEFLKSYFK